MCHPDLLLLSNLCIAEQTLSYQAPCVLLVMEEVKKNPVSYHATCGLLIMITTLALFY